MTTGTYNFVSVILSVAFAGAFIGCLSGLFSCAAAAFVIISVKKHFSDHVKTRLISQLINGMPKFL